MPEILDLPFYSIKSEELADWLDKRPNRWWIVDGDHYLMSRVDFPCPAEELSAELRRRSKPLRLFDIRPNITAHGEPVDFAKLTEIADTNNNSKSETYLLCWEGDDDQWLLVEDPAAAKDFS